MILENLKNLEKSINAELSSKIQNSSIKHNELLIEINENDLMDVIQFLKSNEKMKKIILNFSKADIKNGGEGAFFIFLKKFKE